MTAPKVPTRTLLYFNRLLLWLVLLIIAAGLAAQSVQVNIFTQSDVDERYAKAVAEQMAQALKLRLQDTQRLQQVASRHPYTLNALQEGDADWVADLKNFLPGSQSIQLVTPAQAAELHLSYGFAVQELVTRTLKGVSIRLEAIRKSDQQVHLYWATPVMFHQRIEGVLLVEYGAQWLAQFQAVANQDMGQVLVSQYIDDRHEHSIEVFKIGSAAKAGARVIVPINDMWFLSFVPNDQRPQLALMPVIGPWLVVLVLIACSWLVMMLLQERDIRQNQLNLINYVRGLNRLNEHKDEPPTFSLRLFYDLAELLQKQLRVTAVLPTYDDSERERPDLVFEPLNRKPVAKAPRSLRSDLIEVEETDDSGDSEFHQPPQP